jgi:hypothetical protein
VVSHFARSASSFESNYGYLGHKAGDYVLLAGGVPSASGDGYGVMPANTDTLTSDTASSGYGQLMMKSTETTELRNSKGQ